MLESAFWPSESISSPREISARYDIKVSVSNNDPDPLRNAKAAAALAGESSKLEPFHFPKEYRQYLSRNLASDFQSRDYLAVSPGYRAGDYFSGLGTARWIRQLLELESITELRFVFTGSSSETASNSDILAGLHCRNRHVDLTGKLDRISDLLPVLYGGLGYIGKDSASRY